MYNYKFIFMYLNTMGWPLKKNTQTVPDQNVLANATFAQSSQFYV